MTVSAGIKCFRESWEIECFGKTSKDSKGVPYLREYIS